ncbi:hypothetical protein [Dyadobacter tibetensis]|uniref:hypothetical protein n=1 Tax=Dyadobacter tibetensis TaxID=1211851 RepID=UPI0004714378|nr:hypothetical protein [Dyadobacter tibetensis]
MDKKRLRLEDIEKKPPFRAPERYFDELPQEIMARIPSQPGVVPKGSVLKNWQWGLSSAAAMLLIASLIWVTFPEQQGALGNEPLSGISDGTIIEYLEEQNLSYYDLSEQQVIQNAFDADSTIMFYLDGMDENMIMQQLQESSSIDLETI